MKEGITIRELEEILNGPGAPITPNPDGSTMYKAVAKALQAATAPSRELDAAVWLACFEPTCERLEVQFHTERYDSYVTRDSIECALGSMWVDQMDPPLFQYTASIDATLALVARLKPGFFWRVQKQPPDYDLGPFWAVCGPHGAGPRKQSVAHGATPALALLAALMIAQSNGPAQAPAAGADDVPA